MYSRCENFETALVGRSPENHGLINVIIMEIFVNITAYNLYFVKFHNALIKYLHKFILFIFLTHNQNVQYSF